MNIFIYLYSLPFLMFTWYLEKFWQHLKHGFALNFLTTALIYILINCLSRHVCRKSLIYLHLMYFSITYFIIWWLLFPISPILHNDFPLSNLVLFFCFPIDICFLIVKSQSWHGKFRKITEKQSLKEIISLKITDFKILYKKGEFIKIERNFKERIASIYMLSTLKIDVFLDWGNYFTYFLFVNCL